MRTGKAGLAITATVMALGSAGASCSSSEDCLSTRTFFEQQVWSGFMSQKCAKCHTPDGPAVAEKNAKFVLQPSSYPGFIEANLENIKEIAKIEYEGKSEILQKPLGKMNHGGAVVLEEGSDEYNALAELMDRIGKADSCTDSPGAALANVELATPTSTLRRAALDLAGRLPTKAEKDAVQKGGDAALDKALDGIMKEETFYTRVREIFNDMFLTDRWLSYDAAAIDFMNTDQFPGIAPYRDDSQPEYSSPDRPIINLALAREPLDLITYLIKNNKPFTDVVAAPYTVVNPYSAKAYNVFNTIQWADPTDYNEFHEVTVKLGNDADVPHAGVLSMPAFLNRWQTSPTNRNRGRARRVAAFFLATDVLKIAERPVDATKITAVQDPTRNSEACTVCHKVIDPIAGGFRGFDDNDYEEFDPKRPWHDDMFPPGFGAQDMDPAFYSKALQWLGPEVAKDARFKISAVRTVYKGLTGHDPLPFPNNSNDPDFKTKIQAWEAQDAFLRTTADAFEKAKFDLRVIFKAVVKSAYYRAVGAPDDVEAGLLADVGMGRLLTPEMLNRKIQAVTGVRWRKHYEWDQQHDWLEEDYPILYGGIDSNSTITRLTAANGLIASVSTRMANEMGCWITAWDFTKGKSARSFFPHVELSEMPESAGHTVDGSVADIKKNIQFLHQYFLDEDLALDDPELERTYQLFIDTWHELSQSGDGDLAYECSGRWNAVDGTDLPEDVQIHDDKNYTLRSWQAVMTYLMSDYKFLYE
ncbi:hypothetical protein A7982_12593 [Minicystis rosea]|nr:hypothetical protein A7982_12593 [Minicystis rosea]